MPEMHKGLPLLRPATQPAWAQWLQRHHADTESGVWVAIAKRGCRVPGVTYEQAREEALIHGWIDGLINGFDDDVYLARFTPRRPRSVWSPTNKRICEQLIEQGRMAPSGRAEVERARQDGRWDAASDA